MNLIQYYNKLLESEEILPDPQQALVVDQLQIIFDQVLASTGNKRFFPRFKKTNRKAIKGLYLWGDVGVGKTFLMDCFFLNLLIKNKLRIHFHEFMQKIHAELKKLQGTPNPLKKVAKDIAANTQLICFDELVVSDIADAMLIGKLFQALYDENICMVFTSNTAPDNLYLRGLQREQFLPAIDAIKKNSSIMHITHNDYRMRHQEKNLFYFTPLNTVSEKKLERQFNYLSQHATWSDEPLWINERQISVKKKVADIIWFDFLDICGVPRNQFDYLEIVKKYHSIFVSNVTAILPEQNDLARTFINLIDVVYDHKIRLYISAEKPIPQIYESGRLLFEFARTRSRLLEMQSSAWQILCQQAHSILEANDI